MREKIISIAVGVLIGLPLTVYAIGHSGKTQEQQKQNTVIYIIQAEVEKNKDETVKAAESEKKIALYDVPLDEDIQRYIISESMEHHINPALVLAIIDRESSFDVMATGDGGHSIGLMQINTYWQQERMDKLGVTNLYDPFQNVRIGIDILSELFGKSSDLSYVLMSYNGGESYAKSNIDKGIYETEYTRYVLGRMEGLDCDIAR